MNTIEHELNKNGIKVICPIEAKYVNNIAMYVAKTLCEKFPELKLDYKTLYARAFKLNMYIAEMSGSMSGASYYYKNTSIYFQKGLSLNEIKKLAIHECIHYFQEIKDKRGVLRRLGLCSYAGSKAFGNALNEASVQLMSAIATEEKRDSVTYYGISLPTDSPSYYPLLCNLIKQIGFLTGFKVLFESTFYSNDAFFDKFKAAFGVNNAFKIQKNFEKILAFENRIAQINSRVQKEELSYHKFKSSTDSIAKYKEKIKSTFLQTQNLIISSFFDDRLKKLTNTTQIENYRKYLYSFSNLIGTANGYNFFNDYYISKMAALDELYENKTGANVSLAVVKQSKLTELFGVIRNLFKGKAGETEYNNYKQ